MSENLTPSNDNDSNLYDIVFDLSFLANAVSAQMQLVGAAKDNEFFEIEHIELDEEEGKINVIARKYSIVAN